MSYNYYEAPEGKVYKDKETGITTKRLALLENLSLENYYDIVKEE